jgi:S1-C subfamily serine protease
MFRCVLVTVIAACLASSSRAQIPTAYAAAAQATSQSARNVLALVRPAVIQIKGFFGTNTAQAFHGTGFAVAAGGLFVTNYHVVAERVQHPDKYRLEYRNADGETGAITVLAVDVRHDLALVHASDYAPAPLTLQTSPGAKGERAYSVGYPLDVGLTITEGISNGKVEDSFEPRIHYSGAINAGMSGGPGLNEQAEVIGVNVAGYRFEQLVSFLVPVEHVLALRDKSPSPPSDDSLKQAVAVQMHAHSAELFHALEGPMPTQRTSGYALPGKVAPFVDCNASGSPATEDPVQVVRINCFAKAGLYLQQGLFSGDLRYAHYILTTDKLDAWRFAVRLSALTRAVGNYGLPRQVGPYACEDHLVGLKGFDAAVLVCARGYRKFAGLYDLTVRVSSLNGTKRGFASHLDIYGVEFDPGMAFIRRYVEAMEFKP